MPIYEYRCQEPTCSHQIEVLQKISEPRLVYCSVCEKPTLKRCISAPCVRFSGSGYYETDEKPKAKQRNIATGDNHQPEPKTGKKEDKKSTAEKTTG